MTRPMSVMHRVWPFALALASACRDDAPADDEADGDGSTADDGDDDENDEDDEDDDDAGSSGLADSTGDGDAGSDGADETTAGIVEVDCTDACVDTQTDLGIRICYSCRCLAAFDGWLPSPDEVQCGDTPPLVTYRADVSGPDAELVPISDDATACANPSLLTGSCQQGSKLGQLEHGDVLFKWICRDPYDDGNGLVYTDMGFIGHNTRTGATCYWDDVDNVTRDDDMPPLDLMGASEEEVARFLEVFYHTEGETCVTCHDHDPFVYTPYLQATEWTTGVHTKSPYSVVALDGTLRPTGNKHLVSPEVTACAQCHRIGSQSSCTDFSRDSMGMDKGLWTYEQAVVDAAQPGSPFWRLAFWMPGGDLDVPDFATWLTLFEGPRAHLMECCANPGVNEGDCVWADLPTE